MGAAEHGHHAAEPRHGRRVQHTAAARRTHGVTRGGGQVGAAMRSPGERASSRVVEWADDSAGHRSKPGARGCTRRRRDQEDRGAEQRNRRARTPAAARAGGAADDAGPAAAGRRHSGGGVSRGGMHGATVRVRRGEAAVRARIDTVPSRSRRKSGSEPINRGRRDPDRRHVKARARPGRRGQARSAGPRVTPSRRRRRARSPARPSARRRRPPPPAAWRPPRRAGAPRRRPPRRPPFAPARRR